ncbi:MAG: preprotein translocase subunit SecE [Alphaproteobacteria bacterium]|nr:preprotein translocase subunit SecE [Alphaproteobacteria bacterium]
MNEIREFFGRVYVWGLNNPVKTGLLLFTFLFVLILLLFYRKQTFAACKKVWGFIKDVRSEWFKIVWPSRQNVVRATVMILVFSGLAALFFFVVDFILNMVVKWVFE